MHRPAVGRVRGKPGLIGQAGCRRAVQWPARRAFRLGRGSDRQWPAAPPLDAERRHQQQRPDQAQRAVVEGDHKADRIAEQRPLGGQRVVHPERVDEHQPVHGQQEQPGGDGAERRDPQGGEQAEQHARGERGTRPGTINSAVSKAAWSSHPPIVRADPSCPSASSTQVSGAATRPAIKLHTCRMGAPYPYRRDGCTDGGCGAGRPNARSTLSDRCGKMAPAGHTGVTAGREASR